MKKTILYEPAGRIHPSQWDLINYPPEGYEFILKSTFLDKSVVGNNLVFDKLRLQVLDRMMPLNLVKAKVDTVIRRVPRETDLIYAYNHLVFRKIPWVVRVEWSHILVGRDPKFFNRCKRFVERTLASDNCRSILVWTDIAKLSMLMSYDCRAFHHKILTLPPAVSAKNIRRNYDREKVRLLFVGSLDDPDDFILKGGWEVVRSFLILNSRYKNLELVIRSNVPKEVCSYISLLGNVRVIDWRLSQYALADEFKEADIFVFPSHKFHNTVVLEAMSYGLPVVATNIGASGGEYVKDGETGFVVPDAEGVPYIDGDFFLTTETIKRNHLRDRARKPDIKVVGRLVDRIGLLIANAELRKKMGEAGRYEVEHGKFSIGHRNEVLKKIFDEAM